MLYPLSQDKEFNFVKEIIVRQVFDFVYLIRSSVDFNVSRKRIFCFIFGFLWLFIFSIIFYFGLTGS